MEYKLSILIPTLESRKEDFKMLEAELLRQKSEFKPGIIQIISMANKGERSIGFYRNELMKLAKGKYVCFIDDDDWVDKLYIKCLMLGINSGADCCSLVGEYWSDGKHDRNFYHSVKFDHWYEDALGYYRFPNHLNCIKRDLIKHIPFMEISHGEDSDWSTKVHLSGVLKTEFEIPAPLYIYRHKSRK